MLNLSEIKARYQLAQMAGTDAVDGDQGWTYVKQQAVIRSWQDVAPLHDEVLRLSRQIEKYQTEANWKSSNGQSRT